MCRTRGIGLLALTVLAGTCDSASAPTPPPAQAPAITIRITPAGVSPKSVEIALGARVLFINNDTRDHTMGTDPHPDHTDCPVINQVGLLKPGEQRETGNFVVVRTCGYHDHELPTLTELWGTIVTK
jgi:plastocyanin